MSQPSLLIVSFSNIVQDARVLKQVRAFSTRYEVTTCGYGEAPEGVVRHLEIGSEFGALDTNFKLIAARFYRAAYSSTGAVKEARRLLRGRHFDIVLANEAETVPIAFELASPLQVHVDLHEYYPRLHDDVPEWVFWRAPYARWLCRRFVSRAASTTTVGAGLAREYEREFGFRPGVVTNATPFRDIEPSPLGSPIRLVHSGAALRNRDLRLLIDGVGRSSTSIELDLYLMPHEPDYLEELRGHAQATDGRVRVLDPVPYDTLITTLVRYDMGIHVLPPGNFNNRWALPNKFFDYVQARLGLIVGPSPEMAATVRDRGLGVVTADFTSDALTMALDSLTPAAVAGFKSASHLAANELSAEQQLAGWTNPIGSIAVRVGSLQ